ncbi:MAG TPA: hypothetical protein VHA75_17305 [Rugosimonospora sp.]|nr:hypothetical protein [Rugosimonospora sp.]
MPGGYSGPPPVPYQGGPTAVTPAARSGESSTSTGPLGRISLRGSIAEVGTERSESVSLGGANALRTVGSGVATAGPRALGCLLGLLFAPLRLLLIPSLTGFGRRRDAPGRLNVPVTPFVVAADDGRDYDCVIRGEMRGGFLKLGEAVEVTGRIDRSHVVQVDTVVSLRTQAVTRGWVDPKARFAPLAGVVAVVVLVLAIWFVVSLARAIGGS